jgi:sec-independent protein translocase protein TatA
MFGPLGVPELIFILILALLIFGPKRLPEIGRTLGRGMAEFRKASNELKRTINTELALDEAATPPSPAVPASVWPARTEPPALTAARTPPAEVEPAPEEEPPPAVDQPLEPS